MKLGSKDISKVYLGSKEIDKIYLGLKEIFTSEVSPNGSPSSLVATVLSDTSIQLTWVNGATNQDGTKIYCSTDNGVTFSLYHTLVGKGNSYSPSDLTYNTRYDWYVTNYKGSKESTASNSAFATTMIPSALDLDTRYYTLESKDILIPTAATIVEQTDCYYKWETNIKPEFARDNKVLAYDASYLYLSFDCGYSYPNKIAFIGTTNIKFSYIFANGNILFAVHNKIYLSTDNLATYNEVIVKDIDGSTWNPTCNDDGQLFRVIGYDNQVFINNTEYLMWGNYGNSVTLSDNSTHILVTKDSGVNIKVAFHYNTGTPAIAARHVHAVNFNANDNSFWAFTGDTAGQCNYTRLVENLDGSWTATLFATGDDSSYYKIGGMHFTSDTAYWGSDCTLDTSKRTIFKAPISGLLDSLTYTKLYSNIDELVGSFYMDNNGIIICPIYGSVRYKIVVSKDYGTTIKQIVTGVTVTNANYIRVNPKNINGWYRMDANNNESIGTLWLKLK